MNNPILNTLANVKPTGNAIKALNNVSVPNVPIVEKPKLSKFQQQYLQDISQQMEHNILARNTNAPASVGIDNLTNEYGIKDDLWSKVSPYIDRYGLSVIQGYRDPKTAGTNSAKNSQHYLGNAIDLNYGSLNNLQRIQLVKDLQQSGVTGFGTGTNTLHADIGPKRNWWYEPGGKWTTDNRYKPSWTNGLF